MTTGRIGNVAFAETGQPRLGAAIEAIQSTGTGTYETDGVLLTEARLDEQSVLRDAMTFDAGVTIDVRFGSRLEQFLERARHSQDQQSKLAAWDSRPIRRWSFGGFANWLPQAVHLHDNFPKMSTTLLSTLVLTQPSLAEIQAPAVIQSRESISRLQVEAAALSVRTLWAKEFNSEEFTWQVSTTDGRCIQKGEATSPWKAVRGGVMAISPTLAAVSEATRASSPDEPREEEGSVGAFGDTVRRTWPPLSIACRRRRADDRER